MKGGRRQRQHCMWTLGPLALTAKTMIFNLTSWAQPSLPLIRGFPDSLTLVYAINSHHSPHLLTYPSTLRTEAQKSMACEYFFYLHSTCGIVPGTENILNLCWMNDYCGWVYYFHWGSSGKAGVSRLSCSYWENAERRDRKSSVLIFA